LVKGARINARNDPLRYSSKEVYTLQKQQMLGQRRTKSFRGPCRKSSEAAGFAAPGAAQECRSTLAKGGRPSLDRMSAALRSLAAEYSRVFVVVDALDECIDDLRWAAVWARVWAMATRMEGGARSWLYVRGRRSRDGVTCEEWKAASV
jgi:hypothetical protein